MTVNTRLFRLFVRYFIISFQWADYQSLPKNHLSQLPPLSEINFQIVCSFVFFGRTSSGLRSAESASQASSIIKVTKAWAQSRTILYILPTQIVKTRSFHQDTVFRFFALLANLYYSLSSCSRFIKILRKSNPFCVFV